jgi:hypothetical protein
MFTYCRAWYDVYELLSGIIPPDWTVKQAPMQMTMMEEPEEDEESDEAGEGEE